VSALNFQPGSFDEEGPSMSELIPRAYEELRAIASHLMRREGKGHSLHTTALVHEACLRLLNLDGVNGRYDRSFLALAARAMRNVLIDHARKVRAAKRGAGVEHVPLGVVERDLADVMSYPMLDVIALEQALERLGEIHPRRVQVVELRFFAGLLPPEIAEVLGVSRRTVDLDWSIARLQLIEWMEA